MRLSRGAQCVNLDQPVDCKVSVGRLHAIKKKKFCKPNWGWLPAVTVQTMQPWMTPFYARHQSKVMSINVFNCIML